MGGMKRLVWTLFAILATGPILAQEVEFNPLGREIPIEALEKNLRIQLDWYELEQETLMEILDLETGPDATATISSNANLMLQAVRELVKEDEAIHLETSIVTSRSGQRSKVESIQEFIYPTEYDPPGMATGSGEGDDEIATTVPNPTAFETRNVGTTLEVDPVLGADDRTVDLNLAPELVYLVDRENYGEHRVGETEVDVVMPVFYTTKLTTQITLIAGEPYFAGVMTPHDEDTGKPDRNRKVMLFIRVDLIHTGLPIKTEEPVE